MCMSNVSKDVNARHNKSIIRNVENLIEENKKAVNPLIIKDARLSKWSHPRESNPRPAHYE